MKLSLKIIFILLAGLFIFSLNSAAVAEEKKEEDKVKIKKIMKSTEGEISGLSNNFIAVIYGQDAKTSYEMALNIGKDVKIEHKNSLKDIGVGDIVGVNYEETIETKEGEKPRVVSRIAKVIKFIKAAQPILESSALVSKEAESPQQEGK
jgi:hypothetical protein